MSDIARTPERPYYAVIFTSQRTPGDAGYGAMSERMVELAARQPGFLGVESARGEDGLGITVSYWESLEAIAAWKKVDEHAAAQQQGRQSWYEEYATRVMRLEYDYTFQRGDVSAAELPAAETPEAPHVPAIAQADGAVTSALPESHRALAQPDGAP